uniref:Calpain_III domain-containing protein n=1 Tax=Bursaphelenchus xylophilus TaxID=6326 RepID=A0A1I7SK05_BURXY
MSLKNTYFKYEVSAPPPPEVIAFHFPSRFFVRPCSLRAVQLCPHAPDDALKLLQQVMVYSPQKRLCGPKFLGDKYFDELFDPHTLREGKPITVVTKADLAMAVAGDKSKEDLSSFTGALSN